jgi:alpha-glucosidase (family GH31 glycosyl hydrolase)
MPTETTNPLKRMHAYTAAGARFCFITPDCVRMEYAPDGAFVDSPSLFASHRPADSVPYTVEMDGEWLILRTDLLELRCLEDGQPFHAGNLQIDSGKREAGAFEWQPGREQTANLKGPLPTLDAVRGPVPLPDGLLSRDGWFLYDDSRGHLLEDGWIAQRPAPPDAATQPNTYKVHCRQDWYFFGYGHDYQAGLDALMTVSGKVPLPRRVTLGSWFCRWYPFTSDDYRQLVQDYDANGIPLDIMVLDMDWHRLDAVTGFGQQNLTLGWTGYSWNRDLLPDAEELIRDLKAAGLAVTMNDHPHDGIRRHEDGYEAFMADMNEPADGRDLPFQAGNQKYWNTFWKHSHLPKEADGVDFWWLDWQQDDLLPFVPGMGRLPHLPWLNRLYFEESQKNGIRGQGFSRWGGLGDHRHPIHFSGDIESNWDAFKFEVEFTVRSSHSGCYFWSHDIGGFYGKPNAELYTRWMQFGAFSAALRLHSCGEMDRRPWTWDAPYAAAMKAAMQLRAELMPYVYTAAWQCWSRNKPLLRPMVLEWPEQEEAYTHCGQYLFGDHLLVAPVTEAADPDTGLARGTCWLPPGEWIDWWSGSSLIGGQVITGDYPLERFPLYVRAGAVIPMQAFRLRPANESPNEVRLHLYPGETGRTPVSWLYMDDGISDPVEVPGRLWRICTAEQEAASGRQLIVEACSTGQVASQTAFSVETADGVSSYAFSLKDISGS